MLRYLSHTRGSSEAYPCSADTECCQRRKAGGLPLARGMQRHRVGGGTGTRLLQALDTSTGLQGRGAPAGSSCAGVQKSAVSTCAVSGASSSAAAAVAEESPASTAAERLDLPPTRLAVAGHGRRHPSVSCVTGCAVTGYCRLRSGAGGCRGPAGGFGSCHSRAQGQMTASDDQLVDPPIAAPRQDPPRGTGVRHEYLELAVPWRQQTRPVEY